MKRKLLFIFLSLSLSLIISVISLELLCRLFIEIPLAGGEVTYPLYANDVDLKWKLKKSFKIRDITIDSNGFRTYREKNENYNDYIILALGDSHTFGMGVSDEQTYPAQLERILSTRFKHSVNVINAGVPGYNTMQEITYYEKIIKNYQPKLVLLGIVADDVVDAYDYRADSEGNLVKDVKEMNVNHFENKERFLKTSTLLKNFKRTLKRHSYLIRFLTDRFPGLLMKIGLQKSALDEYLVSWREKSLLEREFQAIKKFNIFVEKNSGYLILVVFTVPDQLIYTRGFEDYQQRLLQFSKEANIPMLDLTDAYMPSYTKKKNYSSLFIYSDGHPNENGYKIIADYITDFIIKKNLIKF